MILISTKPLDTSNFMIFCTLFNGLEQNSQKMQPQNNVKLYPGLPEAPSSIRPNKHKNAT